MCSVELSLWLIDMEYTCTLLTAWLIDIKYTHWLLTAWLTVLHQKLELLKRHLFKVCPSCNWAVCINFKSCTECKSKRELYPNYINCWVLWFPVTLSDNAVDQISVLWLSTHLMLKMTIIILICYFGKLEMYRLTRHLSLHM